MASWWDSVKNWFSGVFQGIGDIFTGSESDVTPSSIDFSGLTDAMNQFLEFEQSSADKANQLQERWNQEAMAFTAQQNAINREFQQASADKAMQFQKMMSDTQFSRAMADLKNAGVNPLLVASGGLSAGGASGSSASGSSGPGQSGSVNRINASGVLSSLSSIFNTFINSSTSKDIAFVNNLTKLFSSIYSAAGSAAAVGSK